MKCPVCNNEMKLNISNENFEYKGDKDIQINYEHYLCVCGEKFTTSELDEKNILNVKREYYKKYLDDYVLFDKVFKNLEEEKTIHEYKYMLDHFYLYTNEELKIVLNNFLENGNKFEKDLELYKSFKQAFKNLDK